MIRTVNLVAMGIVVTLLAWSQPVIATGSDTNSVANTAHSGVNSAADSTTPISAAAAGGAGQNLPSIPQELSLDELARELSHPVTGLRSISNDFEYRTWQGNLPDAGNKSAWIYEFKPVFPIRLDNGKNLLLRATIPIWMKQPIWQVPFNDPLWQVDISYADWRIRQTPGATAENLSAEPSHGHLADIGFDIAMGGVSDSGFISMYGIATVLPASQDISASREQWLLGPELAIGKQTDWGVIGLWATHLTGISGGNNVSTNNTTVEVFFAYGLGNGWQVISNPKIVYDWEAVKGEKLMLPIGGGVAKTSRLGSMPLKMSVEAHYFVASPDRFGPEWLITLNLTPVLSGWVMK